MIVDKLENWELYFAEAAWQKAFAFLNSIAPEVEEGEYEIIGRDVYARVLSYETRFPEDAQLEAHREYVDIQTVLVGAEGIEWFPIKGLQTDKTYDRAEDLEFFFRSSPGPSRVDVYPGMFVTLFPQDAHMPALVVGKTQEAIKKVVVKLRTGLLHLATK